MIYLLDSFVSIPDELDRCDARFIILCRVTIEFNGPIDVVSDCKNYTLSKNWCSEIAVNIFF